MLRKLFKFPLFKTASIELAIENLANEGVKVGTVFREISHADVIRYIEQRNSYVRQIIRRPGGDWIEFYTLIDNKVYVVRLDIARDGIGSVLTSHELDLSEELENVFREDFADIMFGLALPYTDDSYRRWKDTGVEERSVEDMILAGKLMKKYFDKNPLFFYSLLTACDSFWAPSEHLGLLDVLCHEGISEERKARLQCYIAVESLMTYNILPCFRTVDLVRVSEMIEELTAEQKN